MEAWTRRGFISCTMTEYFPTGLPERPYAQRKSPPALAVQLKQGLIPQRSRRNIIHDDALSSTLRTCPDVVAPSVSIPVIDVTYPDLSSYRPWVNLYRNGHARLNPEASSQGTVSSGHKPSETFKLSELRKTPLVAHRPFNIPPSKASQTVPAPPYIEETKPRPAATSSVQDSPIKRFEKLRLPQNRKVEQSSKGTAMKAPSSPRVIDKSRNFRYKPSRDERHASLDAAYVPLSARNFLPLPWEGTARQEQAPEKTTAVTEQPIATTEDGNDEVGRQLQSPFSEINYFQTSCQERYPTNQDRSESPIPKHRAGNPTSEARDNVPPVSWIPKSAYGDDYAVEDSFWHFGRWDKPSLQIATQPSPKSLRRSNNVLAPKREPRTRRQVSKRPSSPKRTSPSRKGRLRALASPTLGTPSNPIDLTALSNVKAFYRRYRDSIINLDKLSVANITQQEADERLHQASIRTCVADGEPCKIAAMPALSRCSHEPHYCPECYQKWLAAQLQNSSWRKARCPEHGCNVMLNYEEIQQYASKETFQSYDRFLTRAACNEDPDFRWCRACDSGQIHSDVGNNIFTCIECGDKVCTTHNTWHEGETCNEYVYRTSGQQRRDQIAQEEASLAVISLLTKKCPGPDCVYNIEKNSGCDHMTCSHCKYEFCWVCLCDYNRVRAIGNSAHVVSCKYHM